MDAPDLRQDSERVGKPPRMRLHQEPKDNLEHIPTHDSTPCTSIWREPIFPDDDQPLVRPIYSLQIYDTTPHSSKQSYFDAVATTIQKSTFDEQDGYDSMQQIRLDFYGLEMPEGFPETERVERCIRHQKKEIAARNATGKMDYYIPRTFDERDWQRELYIIDREEKHWAEGEDGFLKNMFDPSRGSGKKMTKSQKCIGYGSRD